MKIKRKKGKTVKYRANEKKKEENEEEKGKRKW